MIPVMNLTFCVNVSEDPKIEHTKKEMCDMPIRSNLKRLVTLMLCACLLSALTSCFYYPDTDGELDFDSTFYDTYFVEDYNLRHWEVNGWEDDVRVTPDEEPPHCYWDKLRVGRIPGAEPSFFVFGIREEGPHIGGSYQELFIYQSKAAPIPRKDWTIAEIKIFPGVLDAQINTSTYEYKTCYRTRVENAEILYSWTEEGADPVLLEELDASIGAVPIPISAALLNPQEGERKEALYQTNENDRGTTVILCVTFRENPNMAWFATVYVSENGYYLGRVRHEENDSLGQVDAYYVMGESWNLLLEELLHGMDQFETDTAESE